MDILNGKIILVLSLEEAEEIRNNLQKALGCCVRNDVRTKGLTNLNLKILEGISEVKHDYER